MSTNDEAVTPSSEQLFSVNLVNWGPKHAKIRVKEKVSGEVPVGYYGTAYLNYTNDNKNFDSYLMKRILSRGRG